MTIAQIQGGPGIELERSLPSEVAAISPFVDKLMFPLIEPDRQISRIRLSEKTHASWVDKEACDAVCNF